VNTGRAVAVPRQVGTAVVGTALRVDTYQAAPPDMARFATMNPFHFDPAWCIPVPGQPGRHSCSVEAVWQGLKILDGSTDFAMFDRPPAKRPPDRERGPGYDYTASRFRLGADEVDLVTARLILYLPAYLFVLERLVPTVALAEIDAALAAGRDVYCYDWDDNTDIFDPAASFSHSAVLAAWFNRTLDEQFVEPRRALTARRPELARVALPALDRYRAFARANGAAR
jgi:hypothetical protein